MAINKSHGISCDQQIWKCIETRQGKSDQLKDASGKKAKGEYLEETSWDDIVLKFEKKQLFFLYQGKKKVGETLYFNKRGTDDKG